MFRGYWDLSQTWYQSSTRHRDEPHDGRGRKNDGQSRRSKTNKINKKQKKNYKNKKTKIK